MNIKFLKKEWQVFERGGRYRVGKPRRFFMKWFRSDGFIEEWDEWVDAQRLANRVNSEEEQKKRYKCDYWKPL